MADFITLAALKRSLDVSDSASDATLADANAAATAMLIEYLGRDPRADDYTSKVDGLGTAILVLPQYPIQQVSQVLVKTAGGQPPLDVPIGRIDWDDYTIWRDDGLMFPPGRRNVTVTYTAGLDPAPRTLALAASYTVRAILTARGVDLNATGESWSGVSSSTWNDIGPGTVPKSARDLVKSLVRVVAA